MHFYPHNIPDFNNATRHLTRVQRSVYRDAIERYYDKEEPLDGGDFNRLCRVLLCSSDDEVCALRIVLDEFFVLVDGLYRHDRCDIEIAKYRSNSTAKARAGKASAEARKNKCKTPVEQVLNSAEQTNNQELINNNQEPLVNNVIPAESLSVPYQSIVELFNKTFPELPQVRLLSEARKKVLKMRWIQNAGLQSLEAWEKFFNYIRQSDFLMGRTSKPFHGLSFDWVINSNNFTKIYEGNYHGGQQ